MKIYKVTHTMEAPGAYPVPDPDRFAREVLSKLRELKEDAEVGPFQLADHSRVGASFYKVSDSVLVFSEQVMHSEMGGMLCFSGNVHPSKLLDSGEEIFFLNVTAVYNCLNVGESYFRGLSGGEQKGVNDGIGIMRYAFFPKLIGDSAIFRIPQLSRTIFVQADGGSDDFHALYHEAGLKGLDFAEVWSDE